MTGLVIACVWVFGMPGAYSITRPGDGALIRPLFAVTWPLFLTGCIMVLSVTETMRAFEGE